MHLSGNGSVNLRYKARKPGVIGNDECKVVPLLVSMRMAVAPDRSRGAGWCRARV